MKTLEYKISGMKCASCAFPIKNKISQLEEVKEIDINFATEKAKISFKNKEVSLDDLNQKIMPLGYRFQSGGDFVSDYYNKHDTHLHERKGNFYLDLKLAYSAVSILVAFTIMVWELAQKVIDNFPMFPVSMELINFLFFGLASISLFVIGKEFLMELLRFLRFRVANMYSLVGLGTFVAYIYSAFILLLPELSMRLSLREELYFDVTIVVIAFVYIGKILETKSREKTKEAVNKLIDLQSKTAIVLKDGKEIEVSVEEIKAGDIVIIKPGFRIPVDGKVVEGESYIDESMVTGEFIPSEKKLNDKVISGTINHYGYLKIKAEKVGKDTLLSKIIKMVEDAQGSKAPIEKLVDKISSIFVPFVIFVAIFSLLGWIFWGSPVLGFSEALSLGLLSFTGVLIIACPCALGLATPTAIIVGTGKAAQNGILIKDAQSLEILKNIDILVVDKTGTLTEGKPSVGEVITDLPVQEVFQILFSLESKSEHPIALAINQKAQELNLKQLAVRNFRVIPGKGVEAEINGEKFFVGNLELLKELKLSYSKKNLGKITKQGKTPVFLFTEKEVLALISITDNIKENVAKSIEEFYSMGIKVVMLTGDNQLSASAIAKRLKIKKVFAEVLPDQKSDYIKKLKEENKIVAMVGDGINDAPALALADVGIVMSTGSDIAIESGSITLLKGDFSKILKAIKISRFTFRAIKQNLFWAFLYNTLGIPLASGALYPFLGVLLNPIFAGIAMSLSSISVVLNSLRLKNVKI